MNIEIWDCDIDPKNVKEEVTLSLNRKEVKFLLHKLAFLKRCANNDLKKYTENLESCTQDDGDYLNEMINACELDIMDLDNLIDKFIKNN
ncbi:hypothetical protein [Pasteurella multocida]|uniref:Uncharacterized protein n=1 Tax=Pasteurella multocida TaxID=747 RepID=A0A7G1HMF4_PASMD|nr:hypothetical protein [Pasteurella multocida]NNH97780.1 hypothetical protein [Pasteurella multocida]NNI43034.1 hypothetical protein [Pasteurella multocida]BCI56229.1 hypothetical protein 13 [Pasteurella multocida]